MWRSHLLPVEQSHGMLLTRSRPPAFYPNAVTTSASSVADQIPFLTGLARSTRSFCVKDSFGALDLGSAGFRPLFEGRWLWRRGREDEGSGLTWRKVESAEALEQWESRWSEESGRTRGVFRPALLDAPGVLVMSGTDPRAQLAGGGIAFAGGGVVGVTNLFGDINGLFSAALRETGMDLVVRYETGPRLLEALETGFSDAGGMRVWMYGA